MYIPNYQMHNVLNVYSKQLSQNKMAGNTEIRLKKPLTDQIKLSLEGKRKETIEKVAKEIFDKISCLGIQKESEQIALGLSQNGPENTVELDNQKGNEFTFNVIDDVNSKKTNTLSVEDTNFLIKRLERLVEEALEKKGGNSRSDSNQ
ncbi:MAG: hypothetical protein JSV31_31745 [Desulfobacterales bacterium]|nr:MAG: hypothetical protein JSV31_31745 [Desulfobacterales bacterium]